jgi:hypothetical protein
MKREVSRGKGFGFRVERETRDSELETASTPLTRGAYSLYRT